MSLSHDEAIVYAAFAHQLVVSPELGQAAFVEDDEVIRVAKSRQPVGYGDGGAVRYELGESLLDTVLGLGVQRRCCLVEDQDAGVV